MLRVLYEDNHLLVVNKPAGLLTQADRTGDPDLLTLGKQYLKEKYNKPGEVFLGLVHRLDRPVSGVVVLARTSKAAARLSEAFRTGKVEKRYMAVVQGIPEPEAELRDFLLKQMERVTVVDRGTPHAMEARLRYQVLGVAERKSLVDVQLLTGRPHQIRVQFASRGYPILGDQRYGKREGRAGPALYCYSMAVPHPIGGERRVFTAPPPDDWPIAFMPISKQHLMAVRNG